MQTPQAVIEIGSTGIRLLVAEVSNNKLNILDKSEFPVSIGRDVFTVGSISRQTLLLAIQILNRFREQLLAWGICVEETTVIGTSAVREATNKDPFVDRVKVMTGFTVSIIDGIEENRLMYIAVSDVLKTENINVQQSNSIILEVAGGTTEMMLMKNGKIAGAHSMRLGTVIIEQQIHSIMGNIDDAYRFVKEFILNTKSTLNTELNVGKIQEFIAIGVDIKVVALFAGKSISPVLWEIKREDFDRFVTEALEYTTEECTAKFKISYNDVITFRISLIVFKHFISLTNVKKIIVPETSIREAFLITRMSEQNSQTKINFTEQVLASASALLKKYQGDEKHAEYVRKICLKLYDAMQKELGLNSHIRMLLEVSAILHDVGMFIRAQDHNLHSKYIVMNSEIFGLSYDDLSLVAEIVGFHKGSQSPINANHIKLLPRTSRLIILKLTAILRVADALDRSHQQKLNDFTISFAKDNITIRIKGNDNLNLERLAITEKGDLFENVFGYTVVLV